MKQKSIIENISRTKIVREGDKGGKKKPARLDIEREMKKLIKKEIFELDPRACLSQN